MSVIEIDWSTEEAYQEWLDTEDALSDFLKGYCNPTRSQAYQDFWNELYAKSECKSAEVPG